MRRILAPFIFVLIMAMGPAHADDKRFQAKPPHPDPEDMEIIAIMEILKMMDLAKEMEMVIDMEHLGEESQNERTTD